MLNDKPLTAIVPVRAGSQRVKNKNIKKFSNSNLIEIKLNTLKMIPKIDKIILSSDSPEMLELGRKNKVIVHEREKFFASSEATNSDFFHNLTSIDDAEYLLYSPVTSPLISRETINECLKIFEDEQLVNLVTTTLIKHHLWLNNKPLNYKIEESPNSQDLPDIHSINYGCCIIERKIMKKYKNVVSPDVKFFVTNEIESIDIDTELDFLTAEFLYNNLSN